MVESVHHAAIAVAGASGELVSRLGGVDQVIYLRSAVKPLQAMAVIESGAADRFSLSEREIAVMTGSHSSEPVHGETVAGILEKIGLDATALRCGTHPPFSRKIAEGHLRAGRRPTALDHNCSGKHAGMLAAAVAGGHPVDSYLEPSHPVQQRIMGIVADMTGRMRDRIVVAIDGCGAPALGVTLEEGARAFARLMDPSGLADAHRESARAIVLAMRHHPEMVAGEGMLDTDITALPDPEIIAKRGAEGVQCAGFSGDNGGVGMAAKIADGDNGRARIVLTLETLRQIGALSEDEVERLAGSSARLVRNNSGREVGAVRPSFRLQRM